MADRGNRSGDRDDAGEAERRAQAHSADRRRVHQGRGAAGRRAAREEGVGAQSRAAQEVRQPRPARHQHPRGVRRRRSRQDLDADRLRGDRGTGVVRDDVRRAGQPDDPADLHVRHRGAEAEVPARPRLGRDGRRLLPQRIRIGLRRARRQDARHEAGRRQLPALGREDVDQQRRLRRRLHRVREGRRRALHRLHRRAQVAGRVERQGRAQARPPRLVDDADHPAGREGAGGCGARRGWQGPQGRLQRAELRPLQAGRDVLGRRQGQHRRSGEVRGDRASSSTRRSPRSARSSTSSAR